MAATGTPTPNLGLRIPVGTDPASVDDINYNSNLLDTALGAVGNTSVKDQLDELSDQIATKQDASCFHSNVLSQKTYSFNINRGLQGNYWFALMYIGCSVTSVSQGIYMIHIDTSNNVTINSLAGTAQSEGYTFTGSYSNGVLTLTCNSTVWGGIRVIMI